MTQPIAYVSPFTNTTNRYIELQKQILRDCDHTVLPLSIKSVITGKAWGIFNRRNIVCFHWLETRAYQWRNGKAVLSVTGLLQIIFYCCLILVSRARIVYFVHDHSVHDTEGWRKRFSICLIALIRASVDDRVVHDPSFCKTYNATYLPHPLYWDDENILNIAHEKQSQPKHATFGLLGAIRPYKCIDEILEIWPSNRRLIIRGRATQDYAEKLQSIISRRNLQDCVDLQPGHLTDDQFDQWMRSIDVLILAHRTDSMLVSGAFFEGVGQVPLILTRRSPFFEWVSKKIAGVKHFNSSNEFLSHVEQIQSLVQPSSALRDDAIQHFGATRCRREYGAFLRRDLTDNGS